MRRSLSIAEAARRVSTGGAILAYHGLRSTARDGPEPASIHVSVELLRATLQTLRRFATVVPLREMVARHLAGKSTKGLVAITFDDAYVSVASLARGLLETDGTPVTLFVVIEAARCGEPFWWDRIDHVHASVDADRWRRFEGECGLPAAYRQGQPKELGPSRPYRQWILAEYLGRWPARLEEPLARLESDAGARTTQRPMRFEELDELAASPLVDLGVHSMSHPVLPLLSDDDVRYEIRSSLNVLRDRYGNVVPVLAPPFGLYDQRTLDIAREESVMACLALGGASLDDRSPELTLPRIGMTARLRPWKLVLRTLGLWPGVRRHSPRRGGFPALPSHCT